MLFYYTQSSLLATLVRSTLTVYFTLRYVTYRPYPIDSSCFLSLSSYSIGTTRNAKVIVFVVGIVSLFDDKLEESIIQYCTVLYCILYTLNDVVRIKSCYIVECVLLLLLLLLFTIHRSVVVRCYQVIIVHFRNSFDITHFTILVVVIVAANSVLFRRGTPEVVGAQQQR